MIGKPGLHATARQQSGKQKVGRLTAPRGKNGLHQFYSLIAKFTGTVQQPALVGHAQPGPQQDLVATIVHNAGIYNGILAGGLFWAARQGASASDVAQVLLAGALVAGIFGAITMKSWVPGLQAAVGLIGLLLI